MKYLLLFSLFLTVNVFSQSNYILQKNATIYDMPNGEFLTAVSIDDTVFIKHFNDLGNVIWEDSLTFSPTISPVYLNEIARFKNTDEYVISTFADPTPSTPFWQSFSNDTLVYQFTKINLNNHTHTGSIIDTFSCKSMDLIELNDTSIYLLFSDYSINTNPFNHITYSLNSVMNLTLIAPMDSVTTYPWGWSISVFGDSIYKHQSMEGTHVIEKYNFQMSSLETNWTSLTTSQFYNMSYYKKMINKDSVFIFTQGTSSGPPYVQWRMDWLNLSFGLINTITLPAPLTDNSISRYYSTFDNIAIDRTNRKILIMSTDEAPIASNVYQKIFIYDYNFNLVCEIPITFGGDLENSLIELNDFVFLRNDNAVNSKLIKIDCSILALDEDVTTNNIELFPNPTHSTITISNPDEKSLSIVVLSTDGKELIQSLKQENLISLQLNHLPNGMYIIEICDGSSTEMKRIIKE